MRRWKEGIEANGRYQAWSDNIHKDDEVCVDSQEQGRNARSALSSLHIASLLGKRKICAFASRAYVQDVPTN